MERLTHARSGAITSKATVFWKAPVGNRPVILLRKTPNRLNSDDCTDLAAQGSCCFMIHYFLPTAGRPWKGLIPGTMVAAFSFIAATIEFHFYIAHGTGIPSIYGTLAGFAILLLWMYAADPILPIGAETDTARRELRSNGASA